MSNLLGTPEELIAKLLGVPTIAWTRGYCQYLFAHPTALSIFSPLAKTDELAEVVPREALGVDTSLLRGGEPILAHDPRRPGFSGKFTP